MSRSRSNSPVVAAKRRSYSRSRSRSNSRDNGDKDNGTRIHVGDIDGNVTKRDLEDAFGKFGSLAEVWLASYPPWFAFVTFKDKRDAEDAVYDLNGAYVSNCRIRASMARPRRGRPRSPPYRSEGRQSCYECGMPGHFARDCRNRRGGYGGGGGGGFRGGYGGGGYGGGRYRSPPRRRSYSPRSRSRSPKRSSRRSRSRS